VGTSRATNWVVHPQRGLCINQEIRTTLKRLRSMLRN
jgi:hypothetical protein